MKRRYLAALTPLLLPLAQACSADNTIAPITGSGGASSGTNAGGSSTSTSNGGSGQGGSGGQVDPCVDGEEKCDDVKHLVCQGGVFAEVPCGEGQGCDAETGTCGACECDPATPPTCADQSTVQQCSAACQDTTTPCAAGLTCYLGACVSQVCVPGSFNCLDAANYEICNQDGSGWDPGGVCAPKEICAGSQGCQSLCTVLATSPSSVGCSFFALNMDNFSESNPDAVVVANTSETLTANVTLFSSYNGVEAAVQANVQVAPKGLYTFTLPNGANDYIKGTGQSLGGSFRIESDTPVIAYQHSPLTPQATNDASCLLPEPTLSTHYVVATYTDALGGYPSYVTVVATANNTTVNVKVPVTTDPGGSVPSIGAGQTQAFTMNRHDVLQISVSSNDMTGTDITSTAPIAVFGAVRCAQVPAGYTYCDHLEEQSLPIRTWGKTYVGAHSPKRSNSERYYWRVLATKNATTITTTPVQTGFPKTLDSGQFYEFWTQESFIFTGDQPFAAIQYVTGQDAFGAGTGDPAMMTAVPVEQFLTKYVLLTPSGYSQDYVQIIRPGVVDVFLDGVAVPSGSFYTVGTYQVADVQVSAGVHALESAEAFGIMGVGYTGVTSYAYPGGLALNDLGL